MKLIGPEVGRYILIFPWEEVRPFSGMGIPFTVHALTERYKFQFPPPLNRTWKEIEGSILEFREGIFVDEPHTAVVNELSLYSDGFAVQCRMTDDAERVAKDMIEWAQRDMDFRQFVRDPIKLHFSQVVVQFEANVERLLKDWTEIQQLLSAAVSRRHPNATPVRLQRFSFKSDPMTMVNANLTSEFVIERRANEPFGSNRFVCSGPLPTHDLLTLLSGLDHMAE